MEMKLCSVATLTDCKTLSEFSISWGCDIHHPVVIEKEMILISDVELTVCRFFISSVWAGEWFAGIGPKKKHIPQSAETWLSSTDIGCFRPFNSVVGIVFWLSLTLEGNCTWLDLLVKVYQLVQSEFGQKFSFYVDLVL